MPNGHDYSKEYGSHKYPEDHWHTSDCEYGCGCSAGPTSSHGPTGLDPLGGECPNNPLDGEMVGGKADYDIVVTRRIRRLESELYSTKREIERFEPLVGKDKQELDQENRRLKATIKELRATLDNIESAATTAIIGGLRPEDI